MDEFSADDADKFPIADMICVICVSDSLNILFKEVFTGRSVTNLRHLREPYAKQITSQVTSM
jgi:hypothetical protein